MSSTEITSIEDAIYQTLFRNAALNTLVAGKFYTGLDEKAIGDKLGISKTAALISVSYFEDVLEATHGSKSSHMCNGTGQVQIDVAARASKAAAAKIAVKIRSLIYNDINITIAGVNYDISVGRIKIVLSYNETAAAWVAAVRTSVEYDAMGE